jgi:hypothetical protein
MGLKYKKGNQIIRVLGHQAAGHQVIRISGRHGEGVTRGHGEKSLCRHVIVSPRR